MSTRCATHAGTWYTQSGAQLNQELTQWLSEAAVSHGPARSIISPHAGYSYCGSCAAYAYKQIDATNVKRIFILGPSHHVFLKECAISPTTAYETPLYNLPIDTSVYDELYATGMFKKMSRRTDEDEHSIEMQLPYIAKVMESKRGNFTIVPILVGSLEKESEKEYGKVFSRYLADPSNVFVISSDFCHWGSRFGFMHYERRDGAIHNSIETLDKKGMKIIENLNPEAFSQYLDKYQNTICGRHPISVMLNAVKYLRNGSGLQLEFCFLNYQQSNRCVDRGDSSVSYAAGSLVTLT